MQHSCTRKAAMDVRNCLEKSLEKLRISGISGIFEDCVEEYFFRQGDGIRWLI